MDTYKFSAVKGVQANKEFYSAMVPLGIIEDMFKEIDPNIPTELRAQRKLNKKRIPSIKRYVIDNRNTYVFSALAASIDGEYDFKCLSDENPNVGILSIDKNAVILINDGQHRRAAIVEAIKEDNSLRSETIAVVFYKDRGLKSSQQMFTDLNKHAVKTSNSISELYDSTDTVAELTRTVVEKVPFFNKYTDKEKDNLSKYSAALFVFNTFYKANERIISSSNKEYDTEFVLSFWNELVNKIEVWEQLEAGSISKVKLRAEFLVCQSVVIEAMGVLGSYFYENRKGWRNVIENLSSVNWKRNNPVWKNRCIKENNKMVKSEKSICLTSNAIKMQLNIPLNEEEVFRELELKRNDE